MKIYICYIYNLKIWFARKETDLTIGIEYSYKPSNDEIRDDFRMKDAVIIWQS